MKRLGIGIFVAVLTFGLTSCSKSSPSASAVSGVGAVENQSGKPIVPGGLVGKGEGSLNGNPVEIGNGLATLAYKRGGQQYFVAEGVLTAEAFVTLDRDAGERAKQMAQMAKELAKLKAKVIASDATVGYFKVLIPYTPNAELFAAVKDFDAKHRFVLNPVLVDGEAIRDQNGNIVRFESSLSKTRKFSAEMNELADLDLARLTTAGFSGLERIKEPEFRKEVAKDLGDMPINGSSVNVGITDTGITYNHPAYLSGVTNQPRVKYMKEFTGEGTMYFSPKAKASVKPGVNADEVVVSAEILVTPRLPDLPLVDMLQKVEGLVLKVTPEQKAALLASDANVMFTVLQEKVLVSADDPVDMNANGKSDDTFPAFLIAGKTPEESKFIIDFSGKGDFRNAGIIGDFNTTGKLVNVKSEKIGVHITERELPLSEPAADGTESEVVYAAGIVGYDPGNHGSHVAGIVGGLKTIANDSIETLARGVAPEATLMMNRVCANNGGCSASEAMIDLARNGAEVINMSLGGLSAFNDGYSSQDLLVNRLSQLFNTTFVISAGNSGPGRQTIGSPSVARLSMSIGAAASQSLIRRQYQWPSSGATSSGNDDFMLFFSSRGPTAAGGFKPSLSAPGTELSSIQLNSAPGSRGGLEVYWGTSMSAPTAAGAYALLLDAVKKYNAKFPEKKLPADALTLKNALIFSARPFDANRFDPQTGEKSVGQYSWQDQGLGMLDLVGAWKKLHEIRDLKLADRPGDVGVQLDYSVIVPMTAPNGNKYDGTRANPKGDAVFGTGIYLSAADTSSLVQVHISRKLPENIARIDDGTILKKLLTTSEEFTLKTVYYGSDKEWLKVGVRNQVDCMDSETGPLTILGAGAVIGMDDSGVGKLNPQNGSTLNVCVDRLKIRNELKPGDHGAIIFAYAKRDGKEAPIPSFVVPVTINVPHQALRDATAYEVKRSIKSFGVDRNYVLVPEGTSLVKVTLEVEKPDAVLDNHGNVAAYKNCSGVELMGLEGGNTLGSFASRAEARIVSCKPDGDIAPETSMKLSFSRVAPKPGIWDMNVFGSYIYPQSRYKLRVDYITASASKKVISGDLSAISGSLDFVVTDASIPISAETGLSSYVLNGLKNVTRMTVKQKETKFVASPLGILRAYPAGVKNVLIETGGAPGSDVDLVVIECSAEAKDVDHPSCILKGQSGSATDVEKVSFVPRPGMVYAAQVMGYEVKGGVEAAFDSMETLQMAPESGNIQVTTSGNTFKVDYGFTSEMIAQSPILNSKLFKEAKAYNAVGAVSLKSDDDSLLGAVPVELKP